ncbi:hypothetical protein DUI87_16298 [Hirundo rustica rustica]|uniref:Uncharacterized protein n=1 Tax=Hirundo rustica rustica TaxID=333673 RepID=A0A3M0K0Q0_HIRRU|nr:hypothetical protein DUI87_16298 [Hirundo rustica rustica]
MQNNGIRVYTNCRRGNRNRIYADCHRREKNQNKATVSASTQTITEEKGTKNKATVFCIYSDHHRGERNQKQSNSVSVYTSCHRGEETKEEEIKEQSVRIMTDEDVAGPSHPAEETEPEIITRSLSLGELRDLRREFTRQTNESILTWLLRIWDAAANDTILDGSEARHWDRCLGMWSLTRDRENPTNSQPLAATANKCEGQIPL